MELIQLKVGLRFTSKQTKYLEIRSKRFKFFQDHFSHYVE